MSKDIDIFLTKFAEILPNDLITRIVTSIYKDQNIELIKKQKRLKAKLNNEILQYFGSCYNDNQIRLYRGQNNEVLLDNNLCNRCWLYSQDSLTGQPELLMHSDQNHIVLLDNPVTYDINGLPIQKRIKINICYI